MKKTVIAAIILSLASALLPAVSAPAIYFASDEDLRNMSALRGLPEGSRTAMQNALYRYEGLEAYTIEEEAGSDDQFVLTIGNAGSLENAGDRVMISGEAAISIANDGTVSELSADTVIIDSANSILTALGNVSYTTEDESSPVESIEADVVTIAWESGDLIVTDATTSTEGSSSEDAITIYTSGETLSFSSDGGMLYQDGFITSNPDQAYLSITADEIAMLSGSDMFITNAYLSIGRVPLLWLPFFFFPGSQITGNPSIGFNSDRGAFLNTTFELLGQADSVQQGLEEESFMSILSSGNGDDSALHPTGAYYSSSGPLSPAEQWARDTGSYIALMADAYSVNGLHLGVDSRIRLFDGSLTFSFLDGIGLSPSSTYYDGNFRYYGVNEIDYSGYGLSVSLSYPFYSDSRVLRDFGNRLSGFSIFSLLQTPEFPTAYSSTLSSFSRSLDISYRLPSSATGTYVSSLNISDLSAAVDYRWDSIEKVYYLEEKTLPSFSASVSGKIFDFVSTQDTVVTAERETVDVTDRYLLSDPLLYSVYQSRERRENPTGNETYALSLGYSISENLGNVYSYTREGEYEEGRFSSSTSLRLSLDAQASEYASLRAVFTPTYSYLWEEDDEALAYTHRGALNSDVTFALPYIGLEYRIASRLLSYTSEGENGVEESNLIKPNWDDETITSHSIAFRKDIVSRFGTFTPSIRYVLPPLAAELVPGLAYNYGPFALSLEWEFLQEDTDSPFRSDLVNLSLGYSSTYVTSNISLHYQSADYDSTDFFRPLYGDASLSLRTADQRWSITQYVDYAAYDDGDYNYFDSIMTTLKIPYFDVSVEWQGHADDIEFRSVNAHLDVDSASFQLWRGRIYFSFGLDSEFEFDMTNPYASMFTFTPSITFSIAEFLDFTFSFSSSNNAFYDYVTSGDFFGAFFADLGRSFDFFGDGRYNTNFVMSEARLDVVHYMDDWDLHCSYAAHIELNDDIYEFVPEFSVYLSWKIMPDLKIDQQWEYNTDTRTWER